MSVEVARNPVGTRNVAISLAISKWKFPLGGRLFALRSHFVAGLPRRNQRPGTPGEVWLHTHLVEAGAAAHFGHRIGLLDPEFDDQRT